MCLLYCMMMDMSIQKQNGRDSRPVYLNEVVKRKYNIKKGKKDIQQVINV
jgi:hypothetical protein